MKGKLARLAHGVPERPAPRCARARLPAISRALLASPAPAGARARAPHCCAHRPAARSTQPRTSLSVLSSFAHHSLASLRESDVVDEAALFESMGVAALRLCT